MSNFRHPIRWLFSPPLEPVTVLRVVAWWELRRIPFNIIIAIVGVFAFAVYAVSILTAGVLEPHDDLAQPLALLLAPFAVNFCYTAGWFVDALVRFVRPSLSPRFTPLLFRMGLGFSLFVTTLPATIWGTYRLLQLLHVIR